MTRILHLTRTEADYLIELLDRNATSDSHWMAIMSDDIRELFGYVSRKQESEKLIGERE